MSVAGRLFGGYDNERQGFGNPFRAILAPLILLLLLILLLPTVQADEPVVCLLFFYSQDCDHCQVVINEVLPPLQEKYGAQLEVQSIEISDPDNYEWLLDMEAAYQIPPDKVGIPEVFIGDTALIGEAEIRARLDETIAGYLAAGEEPPAAVTSQPQVSFYYFYDRKCGECLIVQQEIIAPLKETYGAQLVVEERDVEGSAANYNLMRALERQYGLEVGGMPEVFIGEHVLAGDKEITERLASLVSTYLAQGGIALPEVQATPTPVPTTAGDAPLVHLAYFYQTGCRECDRA
nr:hypothetical protein [Anaerolineales bacterium]